MLEGERDIYESLGERVGHKLVIGTTRVGKTRLAEIFITQDIHRGDTVIVFDPKGDADLMLRTYTEAKRMDRAVYIFHLGFPDISCRYNAIGSFTKITEVAGRISDQLPAEGNASSFKDFAWGFVNIVAKALVKSGQRPDFVKIRRYINDIDPLIKQYKEKVLMLEHPDIEKTLSMLASKHLTDNNGRPKNPPGGKNKDCFLIHLWQKQYNIDDPELEGILAVFRYDNAYYSKLVASLRPLLDKLTSGDISALLSPMDDDKDNQDNRPIIDWTQIMRQKAVVYVGLDALSDSTVAHAVGAAMFADLTSIAGKFYKFGMAYGLPNADQGPKNTLSIHADEFNELIGDQFIPMINKAGGAGYQVTAYTQSGSDIESGIGSKPKAGVILDNFNTLIMLRVKSEETANILTTKVPEYEVNQLTIMAQATDSPDPDNEVAFTSAVREQITTQRVPAINTNDLLNLPKGQAFAMIEGGQLYKLRLPLASKETFSKKSGIPNQLSGMAVQMKKSYNSTMDLVDINTPIAF
jgi:conjugative coupling factor TraD (TOL family)